METTVFKGAIFTVTLERINSQLEYERVYQRSGVTVFPVINGCIRLIKKTTTDNPLPRIRPVSGYIDDGETPLECAQKELAEELGLSAQEWELFTTTDGEGGLRKTQHFFVARTLVPIERSVYQDPNENIFGYVDLGFDDVKEQTLAGNFGTGSNAFALLKFVMA
jgi:ADP-ribose pyrophosphatase YjhB (NUDIX family)